MDNQIISGLVAVTGRISRSTRDQRQTLRSQNCEANALDKLSSIQGDGLVDAATPMSGDRLSHDRIRAAAPLLVICPRAVLFSGKRIASLVEERQIELL